MPERLPGDGLAGLGQHRVGVLEGACPGEAGVGGHVDVVELDLGLPDGAVGGFAGDALGVVAGNRVRGAVGVFDDEGADVAVVVAGPDDDEVGDGAVADPAFGAVQGPAATGCATGAGGEADDVAAVVGFGEGERAEPVDRGQGGEPAGLLLLGAEQPDRGHGQAGVHGVEGGDAAVAAGQFGGDEAFGHGGQAGAAVPGSVPPATCRSR